MKVYARTETVTGDVLISKEKNFNTLFARFRVGVSTLPTKKQKTVTINCYKWELEWLNS